jgi:hypothetical protein
MTVLPHEEEVPPQIAELIKKNQTTGLARRRKTHVAFLIVEFFILLAGLIAVILISTSNAKRESKPLPTLPAQHSPSY